jgi:hypothetical protein
VQEHKENKYCQLSSDGAMRFFVDTHPTGWLDRREASARNGAEEASCPTRWLGTP